jgi:hypothetical protein
MMQAGLEKIDIAAEDAEQPHFKELLVFEGEKEQAKPVEEAYLEEAEEEQEQEQEQEQGTSGGGPVDGVADALVFSEETVRDVIQTVFRDAAAAAEQE